MKSIIMTIFLALFANMDASSRRRSSEETAAAKSNFISVLSEICPKVGITSSTVEFEVNQFFECMSESRGGTEPNAPLVIPISAHQMYQLFNFKRYKNYLLRQCATFKQRKLCAERFAKFQGSCGISDYKIMAPHVAFINSMVVYYVDYGERVCEDNGVNFVAFIDETEISCTDPNLAGLYDRLEMCELLLTHENQRKFYETAIKENEAFRVPKTITCIMKNYIYTCSDSNAVAMFWKFWNPESVQTITTTTEAIKIEKNDDYV